MKKIDIRVVIVGLLVLLGLVGYGYYQLQAPVREAKQYMSSQDKESKQRVKEPSKKTIANASSSDDSSSSRESSNEGSSSSSLQSKEPSASEIINMVTPDMTGSDLERKGAEVIHDFVSSKQFNTLLLSQPLNKGIMLKAVYDPDTGDTKFVGNHYLIHGTVQGPQGGEEIYYSLNNNNGQVAYQPDSRALPHMEDTGAETSLQQPQVEILAREL